MKTIKELEAMQSESQHHTTLYCLECMKEARIRRIIEEKLNFRRKK